MKNALSLVVLVMAVVGCKGKETVPAPTATPAEVAPAAKEVAPAAKEVAPAPPPKAATCADNDAAACLADAKAIAPQGAYRVKMSAAEADAKEKETAKLAARACELGNGEGCALLARFGDSAQSLQNLEKSCGLGYAGACGSIGSTLADGGNKADRARAAELLEKACDADATDGRALTSHHGGFCNQLARFYTEELKDKAKAKVAHERACKQGDTEGCACKTDADCHVPDDQAGDSSCDDGVCQITGG